MRKKIFSSIIGSTLIMASMSGCASLHVHDYLSPYQHDENKHWQVCSRCGEKFNEDVHAFNNLDNTCLLCDYVDPLVITDENNIMTGLTSYGLSKYEIDIPNNVLYIGKDAFINSKATLVNLNKELIGYYDGAFEDSNITIIKPAEEKVIWEFNNGIYYKHDVLLEYEAMIGEKLYKNVIDAFNDVQTDDTTITLLKDEYEIKDRLTINNIVTLESYHEGAKLKCNFNIGAGGILHIPNSIDFKGNVALMLVNTKEKINDDFQYCYKSGTIAFVGREDEPEDVYVEYVNSYRQDYGFGHEAVGSKQIVNTALVIPITHYAYGSFAFSGDFKKIMGLSEYGEAISDLYITNVVKGINVEIASYAFAIWTDIKINIDVISDTHITFFKTKGSFTTLHVSNGVTKICDHAFTNEATDDLYHEVKAMLTIIYHLKSVYIGDSVEEIGVSAFCQSMAISEVVGGAGLTKIDSFAFYENASLRVANFANSHSLVTINPHAFEYCDSLVSLILPRDGWNVGGDTYFPNEFDPEDAAYCAVYPNCESTWTRTKDAGNISYTTNTNKDGTGRYKSVKYTDDIATAISGCCDNGVIYLGKYTPRDQRTIELESVSKNMRIIADSALDDVRIGKEDKSLIINREKSLMLDNVKPLGDVILHTENNMHNFTKIGGFAIRNVTDLPKVYFEGSSQGYAENIPVKQMKSAFDDMVEYSSYGLFDIELDGNNIMHIKNLSTLGKKASRLTIDEVREPTGLHMNKADAIVIDESAFINNTNLQYISLSEMVKSIGDKAFNGCSNLKEVKVGYLQDDTAPMFESIGAHAFDGCISLNEFLLEDTQTFNHIGIFAFFSCTNLTWFEFGGTNSSWKAGVLSFEREDLIDPVNAAKLMRTLVSYEWSKAND